MIFGTHFDEAATGMLSDILHGFTPRAFSLTRQLKYYCPENL